MEKRLLKKRNKKNILSSAGAIVLTKKKRVKIYLAGEEIKGLKSFSLQFKRRTYPRYAQLDPLIEPSFADFAPLREAKP